MSALNLRPGNMADLMHDVQGTIGEMYEEEA